MSEKKKSIKKVALEIYQKGKRPLHYKDLSKKICEICDLSGKTPHESVRSLIGTDKRFKRVAEGVYALAEWEEYPVARFAKDIAYDILVKIGKSLPVNELGEEILRERHFVGTPSVIARNATRKDARFTFDQETKLVSLREWEK